MRPTFVHFTTAELSARAGADPWQLDEELQAGDPAAIDNLAAAFHQSGMRVRDADKEFEAAKQRFNEAWNRHNGASHPINDSAEVQRISVALVSHPKELAAIAAELEQAAAALATAQRDSAGQVNASNLQLHSIDDQISADALDAPWLIPQLIAQAGDVTRATVAQLESVRGAYLAQLRGAETAMIASGYMPEAIDQIDGIAGDSPDEAAVKYDLSGQRAKDQTLVEKARAAKGDGTLGWTADEQAAAQRLVDYKSITDPAHGVARRGDDVAQAESRRLAGERLDDFNAAHATAAVARDPILGGDARTRAQTRLKMQHDLETGQLPSHPQPLTPDEATKLMDRMEVTDRANTLVRLQETLQQCGMSPEGAARVAEGFAHGVIPEEYLEGASAASTVFDGGKDGIKAYAELVPTGRHWAPGVAFSPEDIETLKGLGTRIGTVGSALEFGTAIYEIVFEGTSPGEVLVKAGGGMAGAWLLGEGGATFGGMVAGPPGAFAGALILGTVGGIVGEKGAGAMIDWLKE